MGTALLFTILHPFVDAMSASVLWLGTQEWRFFFAYNFCAFALQLPFGVALDWYPKALKSAFAVSVVLVAGGGILALCGQTAFPVLCLCCVGNALFHLSAGKLLLDCTKGRSGPIGVFISTGVFGLLAGKLFAVSHAAVLLPLLVVGLLAGGVVALGIAPFAGARQCGVFRLPLVNCCALAGLLLFVFCRSKVGLLGKPSDGTVLFLATVALASAAGAALGGCVAERVGRWPVVCVGLIGSALLYWGVGMIAPAACLAVIFLAQLATGPVLSYIHSATKHASGTAFGFNCLGLFASLF